MATTNVRKQLGPVRKRLNDHIEEAHTAINNDDISSLTSIRSKISANMKYYETVLEKLNALTATSDEDDSIMKKEIATCTNLCMDANEMLQTIDDTIAAHKQEADKSLAESGKMQQEKLQREIEKLKVDTEYKRKQMEKLQIDDRKQEEQHVRLPKIELPKFWHSF